MIKDIKMIAFFLLLCSVVIAQKHTDKVLLKIDDNKVYKSEFVRLFGKNKSLKNAGETLKINDDIRLFIDYKLKLIEAVNLQMDTISSYIKEVARYRNQLVLPYLNDDSLIDSLVKEMYSRSLIEIRASHILVRIDKNSTDTIAAYKKIIAIRNNVLEGADFDKVAKEKSEDPSAKINAGDLGFFAVFRMVFPFENAAYNTPKGEVSEVFRTQFGYHFLKVIDTRKSLGEMEVAHIMIKDTASSGASTINKVYKEVVANGDFEELARKYSDDKRTSSKGGVLNRFGVGDLPPPFGKISFALTEQEKYSKPFKTVYGWHIVKYIKYYPIGSFEVTKKDLLQKTKKVGRYKTLSNPVVLRLKKEYAISVNEVAKKEFENPSFSVKDSLDTWLIVIQKDTLTQEDFSNYIAIRRNRTVFQNFDSYLNQEILEYYKVHLEETDEGFKNLFQEYKNGLLLFDLMKEKIWDAAQNDSIGLQNFYQLHRTEYVKPETFKAVVVSSKCMKEDVALRQFISNSNSIEVVQVKVEYLENVLLKSGDFERDNSIFPENVDLTTGITSVYQENGYTIIVKVFSKQNMIQQNFDDIKGKVISDYQDEIQKIWLSELRAKHKIKIYKRRVEKLASEMEMYDE
ncbi:peptidylprolyl isomerase [Flavicella sp.]|uniref:peptidylprolyl isomerase n=1 Tax=Flavicella sp. TaxID=2957742 RepID=UPI003019899C